MSQFIIPSEIPWEGLKGYEFEELLYWLFVELGAKDLEWRIGGSGEGAADSGRDLELTFSNPDFDGYLSKRKWWIDAKGRKSTVEKSAVQNAVINAQGDSSVDVLVIATNSQFSNPTRDWVKAWQKNNQRLIVKLWEKSTLERMCSENPNAVVRFFEKAITLDGKLTVIETRFWEYSSYSGEIYLEEIWEHREAVELASRNLLALITCEFANGNIQKRSWGAYCTDKELTNLLADSVLNCIYLLFRTEKNGSSKEPIIDSLAYIILCSLLRNGLEETHSILVNIWSLHEQELPDEVKSLLFEPIINSLLRDLFDICTEECDRVIGEKYWNDEHSAQEYISRFEVGDEKATKSSILIIESKEKGCRHGFNMEKFGGCPLNNYDFNFSNIAELLTIAQTILNSNREMD